MTFGVCFYVHDVDARETDTQKTDSRDLLLKATVPVLSHLNPNNLHSEQSIWPRN